MVWFGSFRNEIVWIEMLARARMVERGVGSYRFIAMANGMLIATCEAIMRDIV